MLHNGLIKKADIVLFVLLVVVGCAASYRLALGKSEGETVSIRVGGELYACYALDEDRTVPIEQDGKRNVVRIRDGAVRVSEASCHNQVCVKHAAIHSAGESIICLPNAVVVTIEGEDAYDAISR